MTPKEKAKELVERYSYHSYMNSNESAKQCALIAVRLLIEENEKIEIMVGQVPNSKN